MNPLSRRRTLQIIGAGGVVGLAGCLGGNDDAGDEPNGDDDPGDGAGAGAGDDPNGDGDDDPENDEPEETPGSEGLAYAFTDEAAVLVDPEAGETVETVADGLGGRSWGDVRFSRDAGRLFAVDGRLDAVLVFDTETRELVDEVPVGGGPVHAFLPVDGELWVHSDDEATFYVVDTETLDVIETVESLEGGGHGKIATHEELLPTVYATNVAEPVAIPIDVESYERADPIELDDVGGTHYVQYSPANGMLYYELQGLGTVVFDGESGEEVDRLDAVGGLALSPDDAVLGLWTGSELQFFDATSAESDHLGRVEIDGPDDIEFVEAGARYAFVPTAAGVSVVDTDEMTVVEELDAGEFDDDAQFASRAIDSGDGHVLTTADVAGTVTVIDAETHEQRHEIEVGEGVDTLRYIPAGD